MRFGKRLAAVTQKSQANEPYISYKDLKHVISRVASLYAGKEEPNCSSGDEGFSDVASARPTQSQQAQYPSAASTAGAGTSLSLRIAASQEDFFHRVDADVAAAKLYVQSSVSSLETMVGDWQVDAINAGFLYTAEQLEEVSHEMPFAMDNQEALVDWLMSLHAADNLMDARRRLVEKYANLTSILNATLQYIEVNLTAIRKIFKKFEKKVPSEIRIRNVREYKAHHDLLMPTVQHLLLTVVQIQRIILNYVATDHSLQEYALGALVSQIGPESLALISWLRGPAACDEVLGNTSAARIDVYAKPGAAASVHGGSVSGEAVVPPVNPASSSSAQPRQTPLGQTNSDEQDEDDDEDEADKGDAATTRPGRRRGGRNNRGARRRSNSAVQPQEPAIQPQQQPQRSTQQSQPRGKGNAAVSFGKGVASKGKERSDSSASALPAGLVAPGAITPGSDVTVVAKQQQKQSENQQRLQQPRQQVSQREGPENQLNRQSKEQPQQQKKQQPKSSTQPHQHQNLTQSQQSQHTNQASAQQWPQQPSQAALQQHQFHQQFQQLQQQFQQQQFQQQMFQQMQSPQQYFAQFPVYMGSPEGKGGTSAGKQEPKGTKSKGPTGVQGPFGALGIQGSFVETGPYPSGMAPTVDPSFFTQMAPTIWPNNGMVQGFQPP